MIRYFTYILLILIVQFSSCTEEEKEVINEREIIAIIDQQMAEQIECWNSGDIPCYMKHYWHSDSLLFIGKNGVTNGWQETLENYLEGYDSPESMGQLTFENIHKKLLDDQTVQIIGKWSLERDASIGNISGHYSLIWQLKEGKWVIISDHSS